MSGRMMRMWSGGMLVTAALLWPQLAAADGWRALVVNDRHPDGNSVTVLDTATDETLATVGVGATPFGAAITPDAATAWIANFAAVPNPSPSLQSIDLTVDPPLAGTAISSGGPAIQPYGVAITPDGAAAYAPGAGGNTLLKLDLTREPPVRTSIPLDRSALHVAITPDGDTAYLSSPVTNSVLPVDLTTGSPGAAIPMGGAPRGLAVTPDGSRLVVAVNGADDVRIIATATNTPAGPDLPLPGANAVAVTPDGRTAWVTTWNGTDEAATTSEDGFLYPIDLTAPAVGAPLDIRIAGAGQTWGVAVTPDGRKLYVSDGRYSSGSQNGTTVRPVDLSTTPPALGDPIAVGPSPRWIAITPDQAPVASLNVTVAPPGSPTTFDASGSTSDSSAVARYDWDFGDGATATTSGPTARHPYGQIGPYEARVTLTTTGGTSLALVYTGQTLSRNGGPSARATRRFAVGAAPQPAVALEPALLDFGSTPLAATPTRTATVVNAGTAELRVTRLAIEGEHARDFAVVDNGCATVAPGGRCTAGVRFAPTAAGPRRGVLRIESTAPGSPHLVTLTGVADDRGAVSGRVRDDDGGAVAGAQVQACRMPAGPCGQAVSGNDGRYRIAGLTAGATELRVFPLSRDVAPGQAELSLGAGEHRTVDLTVRRLPALSQKLSMLTPAGLFASGRPSVFYGDPLAFRYRVTEVPTEGVPGSSLLVSVAITLTSGSWSDTWDKTARVTYGRDGRIATVATVAPPAAAARRTARAAQAEDCESLRRDVNDAKILLKQNEMLIENSGGAIFGGPVGAIEAHLYLLDKQETERDYEQALQRLQQAGCPHDPPKRPPIPPGPLDIDVTTKLTPAPGGGGGTQTTSTSGGGWIDPSGTVRTTSGVPLERARVVLQRRPSAGAPFAAVPAGSVIMSPGNRRNPDRTDQLGRFGWDVLAGTYRVRAQRPGCRAPRGTLRTTQTRALEVPPPRLGLVLRLRCPSIRRAPSAVTLSVRDDTLVARVTRGRHARGRPQGTITFRAGRRILATVALNPHTGTATLPGGQGRRLRATYSGDARFAPARSGRGTDKRGAQTRDGVP